MNTILYHRRLSVIDLTNASRQPLHSAKTQIVYNGEVYNFRELREELKKLGEEFKSEGDAEVVLHAYLQWKEKCLNRFNGMFAFAIYDGNSIFLTRDRYGIKPLYYYLDDKFFIFASEVKAILEHPAVKREVDLHALREYFTFQNIFSSRTLFKSIKTLLPGHYAVLDLRSGKLAVKQYWDYKFTPLSMGLKEAEQETRRLFEQAVERQLVSDVPIGSFLSGGMDSGSIVAVAGRKISPLLTFTGGFSECKNHDESKWAQLMALEFGTEHYETMIGPKDLSRNLSGLVYHLDYPLMGASYCDWMVDKLASRFVKVCLSGAGGDELFGGYPWRYKDSLLSYLTSIERLVPVSAHRDFFTDKVETGGMVLDVDTTGSLLNIMFKLELKTYLRGLLIMTDKLSMAHSLEVRVPFLDNDLVDFALKIPPEYKVHTNGSPIGGRLQGRGKLVLREAMKGLIPDLILVRPKQGFFPPDEFWYRNENLVLIRNVLEDGKTHCHEYVRPQAITKIIDEHIMPSRGKDHSRLIWSLLCFEEWLRRFID